MYTFVDEGLVEDGGGPWLPHYVLEEAWVKFFPCENRFLNTTPGNNLWASASQGHWWVRWSSVQRLHRYFDFFFYVFPLPTLLVGFLPPYHFFVVSFFLHAVGWPSGGEVVYIRHLSRGRSWTSGLVGRCLLYWQLIQLIRQLINELHLRWTNNIIDMWSIYLSGLFKYQPRCIWKNFVK